MGEFVDDYGKINKEVMEVLNVELVFKFCELIVGVFLEGV